MFRAAFLALVPLLASAEVAVPPLEFGQRTLDNGLRVIWLEDHAAPVVAIQVWYHVGSKDDPAGRSGFAHLFEHMMFKATKRMPSETIDRLTEDVGGENNAFTADDVTVYHETVPSHHLERLLWAEAERMSSLTVDDANFKTERDVVKEEFRQSVLSQPFGEFYEFIPKQSFAAHPYKRPTIGNIAELDAASLDEVRAFHAAFYRPDNATLVVAGDFDPAQLQRWIDRYFAPLEKPSAPLPRVSTKEPSRTAGRTVRKFDAKVPFPALAVTFLGPKITDAEYAAWLVLERILSGGEASRLNRSLVYEKRLAQEAEFYADLREDLGCPTFVAMLASGVGVDKARTALLAEIDALAAEPVSARELATAKNQVLAARLHDREKAEGKADALGFAAVLQGDAARVNTDLAEVQKVTAEKVQALARKYFTGENRLMIEYLPASMRPKAKAKK
ncbi:MAG: pitrilysin family protein [Chthoniobacteraceae bacterium]